VDADTCYANGWEFARRPTGGGALLHCDEINYAVVAPRGVLAPLGAGEFRAVFDVIGRALSAALADMGYNPELHIGDRSDPIPQHGLCGRSITGNEIALGERKIIAAAQMVTPSGILQHGTIYLHAPDGAHRFWPVVESEREPSEFIQRWADLGHRFDNRAWTDVAAEFDCGFRRHLPVSTAQLTLSSDDWTLVGRITDGWNAEDWHKSR
jgi:lipoate-protein ligase A